MPAKRTAEASASLKQTLKHDVCRIHVARQALRHPAEADEAYSEVIEGMDTCHPLSWVAVMMQRNGVQRSG